MNDKLFLQYIKENCNCEQDRLDIAVNDGLLRAKNDRFELKNILVLAAAFLFTFVICFSINTRPFKVAVEKYYQEWHINMPDSSEILDGYMNEIAGYIKRHLGGE
ncbi:MAG: hypothetical protein FWD47_09215 [Treponema sp.]|nr:hypothetical protein [Treponema sp.]